MKQHISHALVKSLTSDLDVALCRKLGFMGTKKIYPIPRGGVPVAYMLLAIGTSTPEGFGYEVVATPEEADILIDDVIDSGSTLNSWRNRFPEKPFHALVDKSDKNCPYRDKWIIFPWEHETGEVQDDSIVATIRERIKRSQSPFLANDNIAAHIQPGEMAKLEVEVERRAKLLLEGLLIDIENDHNTKSSPKRIAKMYLREVFRGRYEAPPTVVDFPNVRHLDEMYATGPITIRSACSHHFVPIMGRCWIGVVPSDRVIGLSKFNRIVEWIAARPQIQEELVIQIADHIDNEIHPKGLIVIVEATHMCLTWRGVKEPMESMMVNSVIRGCFRDKPEAKAEFMSLIKR